MISRYKAMIFDMDGTLTNSMFAWRDAFITFIRRQGLKMPEQLIGVPEYPCGWAARLLEDQLGDMATHEAIEAMYRIVDEHYRTDVELKPGIRELLDRLKAEGYTLAVATATPLRYAMNALSRLGISDLFNLIVSCEEIGVGKGEPDFFVRTANRLNVQPEDCVMFEDALYAIRSAKKAGMTVCAIEDYYAWRERDEIRALADRYIACWQDLLDTDKA